MSSRRCLRILLVLLCLLALATSASADCAWVLWANTIVASLSGDIVNEWQVLDSFTERTECDKAQQSVSKAGQGKGLNAPPPPGTKAGSYIICLHDTVDPRGPKGK